MIDSWLKFCAIHIFSQLVITVIVIQYLFGIEVLLKKKKQKKKLLETNVVQDPIIMSHPIDLITKGPLGLK